MSRRKHQQPQHKPAPAPTDYPPDVLTVESLDIEAQGIAHRDDGKVVFIEGALPFETVSVSVYRKKHTKRVKESESSTIR